MVGYAAEVTMRNSMYLLLAASLVCGCDNKEDKFDDVAPVTAPAKTSATADQPVADPAAQALPQGHPPVGADSPIPKPTTISYASPAEYGATGPLRWSAPAAWQASKPASSMRLAEYFVPGQPEAAVLSIFYFGAGGGGGVEANIQRWVGQFDDGKAKANRGEKVVNEMKVYTVDVSGTYNPGMAGGGVPPKADHRMLGAIVETDAGLFFFKLVGPTAVVGGAEGDWNAFVDSFSKG